MALPRGPLLQGYMVMTPATELPAHVAENLQAWSHRPPVGLRLGACSTT